MFSSLLLISITFFSKLLGLLREAMMANYLGTGSVSDAYVLGTTLSQIVITGLAGSFFKTYLPTATQEKIKSDNEYNNFTGQLLFVGTWFFLFVSVITYITADQTISLLGLGATTDVVSMAISVCKLTAFPSAFLFAINVLQGYLHTQEKFSSNFIYPVVMNVAIMGALVIGKGNITALSYGYSTSIVLSAIALWLYSRNFGFKGASVKGALKNKAVIKVMILTLPLFLGGIVSELNEIIDRSFSAYYETGALTALRYGKLLEIFMTSAIGIAIGQAAYPRIAALKGSGKIRELEILVTHLLSAFFVISIPLLAGIVLTGNDLVKVVFMRGAFNEQSAYNTSLSFKLYSFSILPVCVNEVLSRVFFVYDDTKRPVEFSVIAMGINVVLNAAVVFLFKCDFYALAITTSICETIMAILYYAFSKQRLKLNIFFHNKLAMESLLCTAIMSTIVKLVLGLLPELPIVRVIVSLTIGVTIYVLLIGIINRKHIMSFLKRNG